MRTNKDWLAMTDPERNYYFRRRWHEPPEKKHKYPQPRTRVWRSADAVPSVTHDEEE